MDWNYTWSWIYTAGRWGFWAMMLYWLLKWWLESCQDGARLRFLEEKVDLLLEHFDINHDSAIRVHMLDVLHKHGAASAERHYMLHTGRGPSEAREYVCQLVNSPHTECDEEEECGELQEVVEQAIRHAHRIRRRKR